MPRATYTGWNLRTDAPGPEAMYSIVGSYLPIRETAADRQAAQDPRPSLKERYSSQDAYVEQVENAAKKLAAQGLLLDEDVERYVAAARQTDQLEKG